MFVFAIVGSAFYGSSKLAQALGPSARFEPDRLRDDALQRVSIHVDHAGASSASTASETRLAVNVALALNGVSNR
jgi:hypothetical protein